MDLAIPGKRDLSQSERHTCQSNDLCNKFYKYYNKYIIKDRFGAGCSYVKIVDKKDIEKYFDKKITKQNCISAES